MPRIDILEAFETEPPAQDFIWPGFLAGTVGALVAPGSTGKSMLALQLACAVASDRVQANATGLSIESHGPVLYLNLEDPPGELHRRLHALGSRFDADTRQSIAQSLRLSARMGVPTDVMNEKFMSGLLKAAEGTRLVIIDTLSRAHGLDENDNGAMSKLVARLEKVVRQTGAGLLYLHHTSKAAALGGQGGLAQAARGASALIDNARWCGNLMKMTADEAQALKQSSGLTIGEERRGFFVKYEIGKQNYGQVQQSRWYERTAGGILRPVELREASSTKGSTKKGDWK
jgi:RecA-family ATPase